MQTVKIQNTKRYDLEQRTFQFAQQCRQLVREIPKTIGNFEDGKQLIRSSGSVHSNYIEANESLSEKDYYYRVKVCRKETKESRSWLQLLDIEGNTSLTSTREHLVKEANELMKIFGAILEKEKDS